MRKTVVAICGCVLLAGGCTAGEGSATTAAPTTSTITTVPSTTRAGPTTTVAQSEFRRVVDGITGEMLALQPELVTDLRAGPVIGFDGDYLLDDLSKRGREQLGAAAQQGLDQLDALANLSAGEELSRDILSWLLADQVAMAHYVDYDNPVNFITGAHANFAEFMADVHPIRSESDAENFVDRLAAYPEQVRHMQDRLEESAGTGLVPADVSLGIARWQIGNAIAGGDGESHPLIQDFRARVEALPDEAASWAAGIGARAAAVMEELIVPALVDLEQAIREIDGRANAEAGVGNLPGGDEYYAAVLRHFLSTDMTPEEVHVRGIAEVTRVVDELTVALDELGYDATANFTLAMRQSGADAGSMPTTNGSEREAVLQRTLDTVAEAETAFTDLFTVKPATTLDVVRPRPGREGGSGAYYRSPPLDGSRNGLYYLSLGGSEFRTLTMDTTTYHEGIPGHHFQLAVQRSLTDLPLHQRAFDFTGYAEGWALYAERLAFEAGLYDDDPLGNIGRLRMELLRAVRMVVDTGIHWAGWSRNEAVDYMLGFGLDRELVEGEVDRYIVWPGQAPAYMVGMLEILRLRDEATELLGDRFDLVGFHDALLSQGSVPVALLEDVVGLWIKADG